MNVDPALIERFGAPMPKRMRRFSLPLGRLEPQLRLAHRRGGAHEIPQRIILDHELVVLLAGRARFVRRDDVQELEPGDLVLVRPFVPHSFHFMRREVEHVAVHFDLAPQVPPYSNDRRLPYEVRLGNDCQLPTFSSSGRSPWARQSALRLLQWWTRGTVLDVLAAQAELLLIVANLARLSVERPELSQLELDASGAEAAVRRALAQSTRFKSVRDLARAAGLSESHLRRVVRGWVGQSPATYLRQQQVSRARKLLADPERSIKSEAFEAGFASPHHFSRVFRRVDGLTPSDYRAAILAGSGFSFSESRGKF
jgi:AraC-like DNA-binding protein